MKTIKYLSIRVLAITALALVFAMPAKAQLTDNGYVTYQVSITLFTHVHIVNGVMIVHSHPSSEKHHTHTTGQVILIAHLSTSLRMSYPYHEHKVE